MVELNVKDFNEILSWFTLKYGKEKPENIPQQAYRTFWKLTFLAEDALDEAKEKEEQTYIIEYYNRYMDLSELEHEVKLISRDFTKLQNRLYILQRKISRMSNDGIMEFDDPILKGVGHG